MFSKLITVSSISTARALHFHLENNKEIGKLIKSLQLKNGNETEAHEYTKQLPLAFTPAVEPLRGFLQSDGFSQALVNNAEASNVAFSNLKEIPESASGHSSDAYRKAVLYFRHTFQYISIAYDDTTEIPWYLLNQLGDFVNIASLNIEGSVDSVQDLNCILAPCTRLQDLCLDSHDRFYDEMNKEYLWE